MVYLTQVTSVLITHTIDALKKVIVLQQQHQQQISSSRRLLLLMGLGTRQGRNRERYEDIL